MTRTELWKDFESGDNLLVAKVRMVAVVPSVATLLYTGAMTVLVASAQYVRAGSVVL
jgi:hypothetical protein